MNNGTKHKDVDFNTLSVRAKKAILSILHENMKMNGLLSKWYSFPCRMIGVGASTRMEISDLIENYNKKSTITNVWVKDALKIT